VTRQLLLEPITKDARNSVALKEGSGVTARARTNGLRDFSIASSKSKMKPGDIGFYRGQGERRTIYLLCPFHNEKTPSCVVYRKVRPGEPWIFRRDGVEQVITPKPTFKTHFHCYACMKDGTIAQLCRELRKPRKIWQRDYEIHDYIYDQNRIPCGDDDDIPF
jgi:hypothetical protein